MGPVHRSFYFVQWRLRVFFRLDNQAVCYVWKRLFPSVLKVMLLENTLPFWDCLNGSRKIENPVKCNACAVNQKIVTAWFSGNALISTEPLVRISWNLARLTRLQTKIEIWQRTCSENVKTQNTKLQKISLWTLHETSVRRPVFFRVF